MIENKDVIQSYLLTVARYDYTVYEKRILYQIVSELQYQLEGQKLDKTFVKLERCGCREVILPIQKLLLSGDDKNHTRLKEALWELSCKTFEIKNGRNWKLCRVIEKPEIIEGEKVKFELHQEMFDLMLSFAQGHRKYEIGVAFGLRSQYSMRFYELVSRQTKPITYKISDLKEWFKLEDKYPNNGDFIKRVITSAQKELDKKSPYSFEYSLNEGRKITHITLKGRFIPENQNEELESQRLSKKMNSSIMISREISRYLKDTFGFTEDEIKNNMAKTFKPCAEQIDLMNALAELKRGTATARNPKGYVISGLNKMLKQQQQRQLKATMKKIITDEPKTEIQSLLKGLVNLKAI